MHQKYSKTGSPPFFSENSLSVWRHKPSNAMLYKAETQPETQDKDETENEKNGPLAVTKNESEENDDDYPLTLDEASSTYEMKKIVLCEKLTEVEVSKENTQSHGHLADNENNKDIGYGIEFEQCLSSESVKEDEYELGVPTGSEYALDIDDPELLDLYNEQDLLYFGEDASSTEDETESETVTTSTSTSTSKTLPGTDVEQIKKVADFYDTNDESFLSHYSELTKEPTQHESSEEKSKIEEITLRKVLRGS